MNANLHIPIGSLNQGATLKTEGKGAVLPWGDDAVLRGKVELDHGQKVKMQGGIGNFHMYVSHPLIQQMSAPFCLIWTPVFIIYANICEIKINFNKIANENYTYMHFC